MVSLLRGGLTQEECETLVDPAYSGTALGWRALIGCLSGVLLEGFWEVLHRGGSEGDMVPTPLGNKRGKGGSDAGLRAFRRLDNQAEWQLLVHLPSTPCSQHCHGNSSSIQGFQSVSASRGGLLPSPCSLSPGICLQSLGLGDAISPPPKSLSPPVLPGFRWRTMVLRQAWSVNSEFVSVLGWASCQG